MPAASADPLMLTRIQPPGPEAVARPVTRMITAPAGLEGEGFPVRRAFAGVPLGELDPFVHMDQMGEVEYAAGEPKGTPWHPHRGFETVTYMIDGTLIHQDSHGGGGLISDGGTQWMTAGSGILHIETPPEKLVVSGGLFHGVQLWVNLPAVDKWKPPRYQDIAPGHVRLLASDDAGALVRVIAGDIGGFSGPGSTHTPIAMTHVSIWPGQRLDLPWPAEFNALGYVLAGAGYVGPQQQPIEAGQTVVFGSGEMIQAAAAPRQDSRTTAMEMLLLGGRPIREPVQMYGPFVMNTKAEIAQAVSDYQAGRLGVIPEDAVMPHVVGQRAEQDPPPIGI